MMSMIGLILLMGLVTKNAILLVDFANRRSAARACRAYEALLEAGIGAAAADHHDDAGDDRRHAAAGLRGGAPAPSSARRWPAR